MNTITLWSKRYTFARGWHWKLERECDETTKEQWLKVFQESEPNIEFKLSNRKPKV